MADLLYLLGTLGFFGAMLGYVQACDRLGRLPEPRGEAPTDER